jgi:hypothetical protein
MSAEQTLFEEEQKFRRNGLWFTIWGLFLVVMYAFFQMTLMGVNTFILLALIPSVALFFFLLLFFNRMRLHVRLTPEALEFQYKPVQQHIQMVPWSEVKAAEIVEASPVRRLIGWGLQFGQTRAFSVGGREGVELSFANGRKLFLGSERARELHRIINKHRKKGGVN